MPFKVPFLICFKIASLADLQDCLMGSVNVFLQVRHAEVFLITFVTLDMPACVDV